MPMALNVQEGVNEEGVRLDLAESLRSRHQSLVESIQSYSAVGVGAG